MGDNQQSDGRPRGRDGRFLPAAGGTVRLKGPDGKVRTYRAADGAAARLAQQMQQQQPPAQSSSDGGR